MGDQPEMMMGAILMENNICCMFSVNVVILGEINCFLTDFGKYPG
jgi:hypothetical protein